MFGAGFVTSEETRGERGSAAADQGTGSQHDLEIRRRRAAYRANHRGTKEMDWLVGRFADAYITALDGEALDRFERFLELPDPDLQRWIMEPHTAAGGAFDDLIGQIRVFHGLSWPGTPSR